jgi:hypothetical protein
MSDPNEEYVNTYPGGVRPTVEDGDDFEIAYQTPSGAERIHSYADCCFVDGRATPLDAASGINELLARKGVDFRVAHIDDSSDTYIFILEDRQ